LTRDPNGYCPVRRLGRTPIHNWPP
jgi:hypothetical protein